MAKAILGRKLGMTQIFTEEGRVVPVTVVESGNNFVLRSKTVESDGYNAVQIGFGDIKEKNVTKPLKGQFEKAGVKAVRFIREMRLAAPSEYNVGDTIGVDIFAEGDLVDVVGTSKGKGFAGVMKRHGFKGVGASHGAHRNHRKPGSVGACATPGRIFKGLRMAGRMGHATTTVQNLKVRGVDADKGVLLVGGAVPGPKGAVVVVRTAVKGA